MSHWTEEFFVENGNLFVDELRQLNDVAEEEVGNLRELLAEQFDLQPANVLDVGCGIGRHALNFAEAGHDVVGIDIASDYLDEAREQAARKDVADCTDFRELDMRDLDALEESFDLVVCLLSAFGYFDDETNVEILEGMRRQLSDDGACVVEVMNRDALLNDFETTKIRKSELGMVVEQREFDSRTSTWTIVRDALRGEAPDFEYAGRTEYQVRVYSPPELRRRFHEVGFDEVDVFKNYAGGDPSREYGRFMVVGR